VRVRGEKVFFAFTAKGGKEWERELKDLPTASVVRELLKRPGDTGEELLGYWVDDPSGDGRTWHDVTSTEINGYLKEISDAEITAKDFRTWNATVHMAVALAETPAPTTKTARKRVVKAAYERVSDTLGNTPAVCKASYVDPRVVDRFESGETIAEALSQATEAPDDRTVQRVLEQAVCQMLTTA